MRDLMQSVQENLSFLFVCLLCFVALTALAWLF